MFLVRSPLGRSYEGFFSVRAFPERLVVGNAPMTIPETVSSCGFLYPDKTRVAAEPLGRHGGYRGIVVDGVNDNVTGVRVVRVEGLVRLWP